MKEERECIKIVPHSGKRTSVNVTKTWHFLQSRCFSSPNKGVCVCVFSYLDCWWRSTRTCPFRKARRESRQTLGRTAYPVSRVGPCVARSGFCRRTDNCNPSSCNGNAFDALCNCSTWSRNPRWTWISCSLQGRVRPSASSSTIATAISFRPAAKSPSPSPSTTVTRGSSASAPCWPDRAFWSTGAWSGRTREPEAARRTGSTARECRACPEGRTAACPEATTD